MTAKVVSDEKLKATTVRIPESIYEWLNEQAKRNHRSFNAQIVHMALKDQQCEQPPTQHRAPAP
jgi:hypothetical protein